MGVVQLMEGDRMELAMEFASSLLGVPQGLHPQ